MAIHKAPSRNKRLKEVVSLRSELMDLQIQRETHRFVRNLLITLLKNPLRKLGMRKLDIKTDRERLAVVESAIADFQKRIAATKRRLKKLVASFP